MKRSRKCGGSWAAEELNIAEMIRRRCVPRPCSHATHKAKSCMLDPNCLDCVFGDLKSGVWAEPLRHETWLGPDPKESRREQRANGAYPTPCGLDNLGATCYLNVLVQALCHNLILRNTILRVDTAGSSETVVQVVHSLQVALGHMLLGPAGTYSLQPFVELMGLSASVQQDPHEFHKLFFDMIGDVDSRPGGARSTSLRTYMTGTEVTSVICNSCGRESRNIAKFSDIELSIENGSKNIEDCLKNYYGEELLVKENQYFCSNCNHLRDAARRTVLETAPTVLSLHLVRNVYDRASFQKRKLMNEIMFNRNLTLDGNNYVLVAVLYHKGNTGHGGHYVAEILDWKSGQWWFFNDEEVTKVDDMESFFDSCASEAGEITESHIALSDSKLKAFAKKPSRKRGSGKMKMRMTSAARKKEAYLLSYVRECDLSSAAAEENAVPYVGDIIQESVSRSTADMNKAIAAYDSGKHALEQKIHQRIEIVSTLRNMSEIAPEEQFFLVPTVWLESWVNGIDTSNTAELPVYHLEEAYSDIPNEGRNITLFEGGINNRIEVCKKHGNCKRGLCPYDLKKYKYVSDVAYGLLLSATSGCSEDSLCGKDMLCVECVQEICESGTRLQNDVHTVDDILSTITANSINDVDESCQTSLAFCVSKDSISELKKKRDLSKKYLDRICQELGGVPSKRGPIAARLEGASIDACELKSVAGINASLQCVHGLPRPNFKKKSMVVSKDAWCTLSEKYSTLIQWIEISAHDIECGACLVESTTSLELKRATREERSEETNSKELHELFMRKKRYPQFLDCMMPSSGIQNNRKLRAVKEACGGSGTKLYLVTTSWLDAWREYIEHTDISAIDPFDPSGLMCVHGHALIPECFRTIENFAKTSEPGYCNEAETRDGLPNCELITEEQYRTLSIFGRIVERGEVPEVFVTVTPRFLPDDIASWLWTPSTCDHCVGAAKDEFIASRSTFTNASVQVVKLRRGELPPPGVEGDHGGRQRRFRRNQHCDVVVCSDDTVGLLKMKIFERIPDAVPILQRLFLGSTEIIGNTETLQSIGALSGATFYVAISEDGSDGGEDSYLRSIGVLNDHEFAGASSSGIPEHGFSGTVLLNKKCNNHREMTVVDLSSDSADCHDDVLQNCDKLTSIATPPRDNVSIIDRVGKRRRVDHGIPVSAAVVNRAADKSSDNQDDICGDIHNLQKQVIRVLQDMGFDDELCCISISEHCIAGISVGAAVSACIEAMK